jgi:hypothetical protein
LTSALALAWTACGDDTAVSKGDAGTSHASQDSGTPGADAGLDAGTDAGTDAALTTDAGAAAGSVTMKIPSSGGTVSITGSSGKPIAFEFPASAGGKTITLTPGKPEDLGWNKGDFSDVIKLEPDGTTFSDPVIVKPGSKDVLVLTLPSSSTQSQPEGLALNATGDGLELSHFSTLVVVSASTSCGATSGWTHAPESDARCTLAGYTDWLNYACTSNPFCKELTAHCCAPPGAKACALGFNGLSVNYGPLAGTATPPSYCSN